MKELFELIEKRRGAQGFPHAIATVLRVDGSSYRRPGARMLINARGRVAGSISGGCLERSVVAEGQRAILDGQPRLLAFDTTDQDDLALGTSLGCQGKIWIGLEVLPPGLPWTLEKIVADVGLRREPAVLVTKTAENPALSFEMTAVFDEGEDPTIAEIFCTQRTRYDTKRASLLEWLAPPLSLLLFGGGPDVGPITRLAAELGYQVTVIDRRPDIALRENFPQAQEVILAKPHELTKLLRPDDRTATVVMNHHYETDRDVLAALTTFRIPYIAMLGPRRRTTRILEELTTKGLNTKAIAQGLHAPAGLDIGAETPEQIALAILAEIQATFAGRTGGNLRERNAPIHADAFTNPGLRCGLPA